MRWVYAGLLMTTVGVANAQTAYPPVAIDPATVASKATVDALAATVATKSDVNAIAAQIPVPASTVPPAETIGGAAGDTMTFRRGDAVQPRITRAVAGTTGTGGTYAASWTALGAVPLVLPIPMVANGAAQVPLCAPVDGTITSTGATIKCYTTQSVTVSLLGAVVAPITTAAAGVKVQVFAIPMTQ